MLYFPMPDERMWRLTNSKYEKDIQKVLDTAPRADPSEKLCVFQEGGKELVQTLKKPATFVSKFHMQMEQRDPKLYLSILITFISISSFDRDSTRESLSQATFSDTQIAYALFLALGFAHLVISMATFYTFVQVRVPVIRYMRLRATKLEMMESIEEGSDTTDSAAQGRQLFRQQAVYITGLSPDLDTMELRPLFRNYGIITALQSPMNATWAVVCFLGEVQDDMVKSKVKGPDGRWEKEFYPPQTKAALNCCQAINSGKLDNQLCVMDEDTGKPASAAQVNAEIIAMF